MDFVLGIRKAEDQVIVTHEVLTLGQALELVVLMFNSRGRQPVQVTEFRPGGVKISFPVYIGFLGDKPLVQPDHIPGYSGGFVYHFSPYSSQDYDQLIEMLTAYLFAYPELGSDEVNEMMNQIKPAA